MNADDISMVIDGLRDDSGRKTRLTAKCAIIWSKVENTVAISNSDGSRIYFVRMTSRPDDKLEVRFKNEDDFADFVEQLAERLDLKSNQTHQTETTTVYRFA